MNFSIDTFFKTFLRPPTGSAPQDIASKISHYIDVANSPEQHTTDKNPFALRAIRRNARQNLRRLVNKHPSIAARLMKDHANKASQ
jgi:hypothetical protein